MSSKEKREHENQNHYEKNQLVLAIKTEQRLNWNLLNYVLILFGSDGYTTGECQ